MGFEVHVALWRKSVLNFGKPFSFISGKEFECKQNVNKLLLFHRFL